MRLYNSGVSRCESERADATVLEEFGLPAGVDDGRSSAERVVPVAPVASATSTTPGSGGFDEVDSGLSGDTSDG